MEINLEHRKLGLFIVTLSTWEDIQVLLDQYPDVRDQYYAGGLTSTLGQLQDGVSSIDTKLDDLASGVGHVAREYANNDFDQEIDAAKTSIDKKDLTIGKWRLSQ